MQKIRVIKAQDIVKDIRARLTNEELMAKYRFTTDGLQAVLNQLLEIRAVLRAEIYERLAQAQSCTDDSEVQIESLRGLPRHVALFPIPVYDGKNPKISGMLRDITEKGVGVSGIQTNLGETRNFVVLGDEFVAVEFETFAFDAVCRWVRIGDDEHPYIAGFEIVRIDDKDLEELRKLIRSLACCELDR